jgi:hypothetical protein
MIHSYLTAHSASTKMGFTIRSALQAHGHRVDQVQYVTDDYVLTEVGRSVALFSRSLDGRFIVDRGRRVLTRIDPSAQKQHVAQIRSLLGSLQIVRDDRSVLIGGHWCQSIRVTNQHARLVLSIETYCTRMDELVGTALNAERVFDAAFQPFVVPLCADEIVVRSTTRAVAASFGQSQTLQLVAFEPCIPDRAAIEGIFDFDITG